MAGGCPVGMQLVDNWQHKQVSWQLLVFNFLHNIFPACKGVDSKTQLHYSLAFPRKDCLNRISIWQKYMTVETYSA